MNNKDEILVDSEDYIYGTIYSIGGVKPSIRLKTTNGERIKIQVTKEDIKSFFSKFLYEECGMLVEFKEDLLTGKRSKYKLKKMVKYKSKVSEKELKAFLKEQTEAWSKIENLEEKLEEWS